MNYAGNNLHKKDNKNLIITCICLYFLSLPLGAMSFAALGSVLKFIAVIPIAAILISKEPKFRISKITFLQLLYTFLLFTSVIYSINVSDSLQRVETNVMFCILLICIGSVIFKEIEIEKLRKALIWSSRITCILMIVFGTTFEDRLVLSSFITEDPNYLNGYLLFGAVNAIQMIISKADLKNKSIAVTELLLYIYASLATGSRGGLFCLLGSALIIFFLGKAKENKLREIAKKIGLLLLITLIILIVVKYIPGTVLDRFTFKAIMESNGTDRFTIWGWAISIYQNAPMGRQIFGFGAGTIQDIFGMHGYLRVVSHNIFIEQLMEGGIITIIVYCWLIVSCISTAIEKRDFFMLAVLVGLIILSMDTSLYAFKPYWNAIIFTNLYMKKMKREELIKTTNDVQDVKFNQWGNGLSPN